MQNAQTVYVLVDESVDDQWTVHEKLTRLLNNGYELQPQMPNNIRVYKPTTTARPLHEFISQIELPNGLYITEELDELNEISTNDIATDLQSQKDWQRENEAQFAWRQSTEYLEYDGDE